ncbi:MAG: Pyruvate/2-oxoacid:ferredoxin oxidoreductase delta subunit, partial [Yoonia sp.]
MGTACVKTKNRNYKAQSYINIEAHSGCFACANQCSARLFAKLF